MGNRMALLHWDRKLLSFYKTILDSIPVRDAIYQFAMIIKFPSIGRPLSTVNYKFYYEKKIVFQINSINNEQTLSSR